ncbi:MAG: DUF418 domain-containing protein [Gemmatimonadaceae bacterium]|jgi:uncharacterized protein|nr:DUF418 domain-containing protein [Gemmatimonadaceae bacterium]
MTMPTAEPRALAADLLRGVALCGILVVNLPFLANTIYVDPTSWRGADAWAQFVVRMAFEAKFYILFAALFGYGFHGLQASSRLSGAAPGWRYARRLLGLLLFGVLHATCLFVGDILVSYAVLGGALWWARDWTDARLRRTAAGALVVAVAGRALLGVGLAFDTTTTAELAVMHARALEGYRGTFVDAVGQRLADLVAFYVFTPLFNWPTMIAAFLVGYAGARHRVLARPGALWRRWRRVVPWLTTLGLTGNAVYAAGIDRVTAPTAIGALLVVEVLSAPALSAVYVLVTCWVAHRCEATALVRRVATAGRLSLTIYLGQAVLANALFMGWGFGLFGRLGPLVLLLLAPVLYAALVVAAGWWGARFRLGPDEWLLRSLTNWRLEPMTRRAVA